MSRPSDHIIVKWRSHFLSCTLDNHTYSLMVLSPSCWVTPHFLVLLSQVSKTEITNVICCVPLLFKDFDIAFREEKFWKSYFVLEFIINNYWGWSSVVESYQVFFTSTLSHLTLMRTDKYFQEATPQGPTGRQWLDWHTIENRKGQLTSKKYTFEKLLLRTQS